MLALVASVMFAGGVGDRRGAGRGCRWRGSDGWIRGVVGRLGCSAGQGPGAVGAGEATTDQVAQVQRRGAPLEPGVVLDGAAVAQLDPLPALAGDLGDDPLGVPPVVAVGLA